MYDSNDLLNTPIYEEDDIELKPVKMANNGERFDVTPIEDIMNIPIDGYISESKEIHGCFPHKAFTKQWYRLGLTASEFKKLKKYLIQNPESGKAHPRTGGAWKLRWQYKDEGSQGGLRIIYAYIASREQICALMCYPHTGQYGKSKLSSDEEKWVRDEIQILEKAL